MEPRSLPIIENSTLSDTPPTLLTGTDHEQANPPEDMEAEARKVLALNIHHMVDQNQKRGCLATWFFLVFYSSLFLIMLLGPGEIWVRSPLFYLINPLIILGVGVYLVRSSKGERQHCNLVLQSVIHRKDVRTVGLLVDVLNMGFWQINQTALEALIELLPRLRPNDENLLNAEQRALLCRILNTPLKRSTKKTSASTEEAFRRAVSFRVAILQAFAQIGNRIALPIVERLAHNEAKTEDDQRIQEAALECLPLLQLRIEQQKSTKTLLRPASASDATGETLLRPTTGIQEAPPDQLLRPHQPHR